MRVLPNTILPSQDFLKPETINYILQCIKSNQLDRLPPSPIVRRDQSGRLIAIDGHNLIAVKLYLGKDVDVHIAKSADDDLPGDSPATVKRNHDLREGYEAALINRDKVLRQGVRTFGDLIHLYPSQFPT